MEKMKLSKFVDRYCVDEAEKFRLADRDSGDTGGLDIDKREAKDLLAEGIDRLSDLQERLYAQDRWALLASSRRWTQPVRTAPSSM